MIKIMTKLTKKLCFFQKLQLGHLISKTNIIAILLFFIPTYSYSIWIEDHFKKENPQILNTMNDKYPILTQWLISIIKQMETVGNQSIATGVKRNLYHLYIYHSSKRESSPATIYRRNESDYAVMINSDFLKRLFRDISNPDLSETQRAAAFNEGLLDLMGTVAHEMGHIFSSATTFSKGDQISEVVADQIGITLLRKIGLPKEGIVHVVNFLRHEFHTHSHKAKFALALDGISTHPHGEIRKSAARMNTVLDSFQLGAYSKKALPRESSLMSELKHIPDNTSIPQTLQEAMDRVENTLKKIPDIQNRLRKKLDELQDKRNQGFYAGDRQDIYLEQKEFKKSWIEYCQLMDLSTDFDWMIIRLSELESKSTLSPEFRKRFIRLAKEHFKWPELLHRSKEDDSWLVLFSKKLCDDNNAPSEAPSKEFVQAVENSPLLNDSEFLEVALPSVSRDSFLSSDHLKLNHLEHIWRSQRYVPRKHFAEYFVNYYFPKKFEMVEKNPVHGRDDFRVSGRPLPTEKDGAIFPDSELTKLKIMSELGHRISSQEFVSKFLEELENKIREKALISLINFKNIKINEAKWKTLDDNDRIRIKQLAEFVWNHRAHFGLLEIQWNNIWNLLGISPEVGKQKLQEAVLTELKQASPSGLLLRSSDGPRPWADHSTYNSYEDDYQELSPDGQENSPDYWGGDQVLTAILKHNPLDRYEQQRIMPLSFAQIVAKKIKSLWKNTNEPREFGPFVEAILTKEIELQNFHAPFLTASNINSKHFYEDTLEFQANKPEYPFWKEVLHWIDSEPTFSDSMKRLYLLSLIETTKSQKKGLPFSQDLEFALHLFRKYRVFQDQKDLFQWVQRFGDIRWKNWKEVSQQKSKAEKLQLCKHQKNFLSIIDTEVSVAMQDITKDPHLDPQNVMEQASFFLDPELPLFPPIRLSKDIGPQGTAHCIASEFNLRNSKKILIDWLLTQNEDAEQIVHHFELLTLTGSTADTDRYLKTKLSSLVNHPRFSEWRTRWLTPRVTINRNSQEQNKLIFGAHFLTELVKSEIEQSIQNGASQNQPPSVDSLISFVINQFPNKSKNRDDLLEMIAWKFPQMSLPEIQTKIKPLKTQTLDGSDYPYFVNIISVIGSFIEEETLPHKAEWVKYLKDPNPRNKAAVFAQMRQWNLDEIINNEKNSKEQWMESLHQQIISTLPDERIPFFEFLIGAVSFKTPKALYQSAEVFDPLLSEIAKLNPTSQEKQILQAYLNSCAPYEQTPILAYFIAHQGESEEGGGGIKSLFEAFSTVGIKTGQLASVLDIFNNAATRKELSSLKDNAKPLDKAEILEILEKALGTQRFSQIKSIHRILGSASIKNVIEVEWTTGERSAAMIRRPNAKQLIQEHLIRTSRFLEEMRKNPFLHEKVATIEPLSNIVEEELREEVEFEKEMNNVKIAGNLHGTSKLPKKYNLDQLEWKIEVPQPDPRFSDVFKVSATDESAPTVMFMEMAKGVPFYKLGNLELKKQAGKVIVTELINQLFSNGFMNADPHQGNFLIDEGTHTIHPIDFGQAEMLNDHHSTTSTDERIQLALLLAAIGNNDIHSIIKYGSRFFRPIPSDEIQKGMFNKLKETLRTSGRLDVHRVITVFTEGMGISRTTTINESNSSFKKFFGILKGLAVLQQENYVSEIEFKNILSHSVEKTIKGTYSGMGRYALDKVSQTLNHTKEKLVESIISLFDSDKGLQPPHPTNACKQ